MEHNDDNKNQLPLSTLVALETLESRLSDRITRLAAHVSALRDAVEKLMEEKEKMEEEMEDEDEDEDKEPAAGSHGPFPGFLCELFSKYEEEEEEEEEGSQRLGGVLEGAAEPADDLDTDITGLPPGGYFEVGETYTLGIDGGDVSSGPVHCSILRADTGEKLLEAQAESPAPFSAGPWTPQEPGRYVAAFEWMNEEESEMLITTVEMFAVNPIEGS